MSKSKKQKIHSTNKNQPAKKDSAKKTVDEKTKKRLFYFILIFIPLVFIIILELCLKAFNYGNNYSQWLDAGNGKFIINPELGKKYFHNVKFVPLTNEDTFDQEKKGNTFRVFILGESTAAGYPYMPMGSFSRYIRKRLELVYPDLNIEVVNIGMTGISSYVIRDLVPGVLEQMPDLLLIYAGHNEYYGALGVGSVESAASPFVIKTILTLNNFKITQLVRNSINWLTSLFNTKEEAISGTLMSRMAKDQYITIDSDTYKAGILQFEENLSDILKLCNEQNTPVIIGTLISNLKDQRPFVTVHSSNNLSADNVYKNAISQLELNNITKADSLFKLAKDLDALRFRAPSVFNTIIKKLAAQYHANVVLLDSVFASESSWGIPGNDLLTDHLHPNLKGYQIMGRAFYDKMVNSANIPKTASEKIAYEKQDSLTINNFVFTELDSVIGNYTILLLKNDWPFVAKGKGSTTTKLFHPQNFIDSLALKCIENKLSWSDAHLQAAIEYLKNDNIRKHIDHMNVLIYQYPTLRDYNSALRYFYDENKVNPSDFTVKRIGIIQLYNNHYDEAIKLLTESLQTNTRDAEIYFYLAKAYLHQKQYTKALEFINNCLKIKSLYPEAYELKTRIEILI